MKISKCDKCSGKFQIVKTKILEDIIDDVEGDIINNGNMISTRKWGVKLMKDLHVGPIKEYHLYLCVNCGNSFDAIKSVQSTIRQLA